MGTGLAGFVTVPLAGSPPHILFSCGLSYITAFQDTEWFDCVSGAVFDLQPFIQNHSIPPLPSPPSPNDNAKLVSQNPAVTVPAGQIFTLYFGYENVGNTIWADTNGYQLRCDQFYVKESNCMGNASDGFNGAQIRKYLPPNIEGTKGARNIPDGMEYEPQRKNLRSESCVCKGNCYRLIEEPYASL